MKFLLGLLFGFSLSVIAAYQLIDIDMARNTKNVLDSCERELTRYQVCVVIAIPEFMVDEIFSPPDLFDGSQIR